MRGSNQIYTIEMSNHEPRHFSGGVGISAGTQAGVGSNRMHDEKLIQHQQQQQLQQQQQKQQHQTYEYEGTTGYVFNRKY